VSGKTLVRRFSRTERALHWIHATAFFVLLGSGLVLYLPSLAARFGSRLLVRDIHLYTALGWLVAIALTVGLGDRRGLRRTLRDLDGFDDYDWRWLRLRRPAPQGRFNAGQKLNTILTAAFAVLFSISGLLLWLGERNHRFRLDGSVLLHDWLTYASVALVAGHLYLALVHRSTRHSIRGMVLGTVREDWARAHHPAWRAMPASGPRRRSGLPPKASSGSRRDR
jgi:formate dehydrogenase subunit gamma